MNSGVASDTFSILLYTHTHTHTHTKAYRIVKFDENMWSQDSITRSSLPFIMHLKKNDVPAKEMSGSPFKNAQVIL